jgi:hypothetical protein
MRARIASRRVVGISLVVLSWSSGSGARADDAVVGELGPIRQWVAQNNSVAAQTPIGPPVNLRVPSWGRSHAEQGAIVGAVIGGVAGGWYFAVMGGWGCADTRPHANCKAETLGWAAAGAAGGALVGGAAGGLIGSLLQAAPSPRAEPSGPRTRVIVVPGRRGVGVAVAHSF